MAPPPTVAVVDSMLRVGESEAFEMHPTNATVGLTARKGRRSSTPQSASSSLSSKTDSAADVSEGARNELEKSAKESTKHMPGYVHVSDIARLKSSEVDYRHPLYVGDWKRSIPYVDKDMAIDDLDEPHIKRKHAILSKYPEIEQLYGYDPSTKWITLVAALSQVTLAYYFGRINPESTWMFYLVAYFIGASFTQLYGVIIHECTHCLTARTPLKNRFVGLLANVGLVFPIAMSFRRYHLEHHSYQGVTGMDPDLPLPFELRLVRGSAILKLIWLFFYPMMYVVRGAAMQKKPTFWELINWAFTITTDALIINYCGLRGFWYLVVSLWLGYGIHPAAAHFIQEHYTFDDGQETYSYYGILNYFFLNIGYHNEHHDFTKVAWSKLPSVRSIAPEFYDSLAYHTSWVAVLWNFVTQRSFGPQSRVGRDIADHRRGRAMVKGRKLQKFDAQD